MKGEFPCSRCNLPSTVCQITSGEWVCPTCLRPKDFIDLLNANSRLQAEVEKANKLYTLAVSCLSDIASLTYDAACDHAREYAKNGMAMLQAREGKDETK